jgi:eukaryotic-like serine/threonine-protein kinase
MVVCPVCRASYPEGTSTCPADGSALLPAEAFSAAEARIEPGTMIGEYRVERKLGEGSFGAVYAGVQPLIGKRVAIKVLHKRMSSEPEVVARFIGEARAVNRIGHRNIIDVFSFGIHAESQHYFVMELCDGLTLAEMLQRDKRLDLAKALPILRGIADGLDAAHAAGVTHRDLKPDNVFLVREKDGSHWPKLLDFGVAKLVTEENAQKTATGVAIGTPRYMSPEQSRGKKVDHRADIYALGAVAHEMLTGKYLFEADSTVDLLFKHATEEPPPMSSVHPGLPPELDAPILAMLAKRPAARPSSAGAAIAAIEAKAREIATGATAAVPTPPELARLKDEDEEEAAEATAAPAEEAAAEAKTEVVRTESTGTLPSADVAKGTGTVGMPVSPNGTLLGEPLVVADSAPAPRVPAHSSEVAHRSAERASGSRKTTMIFGAIAVVGIALFALSLRRQTSLGVDERPSPSAASSAPAAPPENAASVTIRFAVMPADARVLLDGREVGPASEPLVVARGKTPRAVRIERQGYEAQTMWIKPDDDKEIGPISLTALAAPAAASSSTAKATVPPGKTPAKKINKEIQIPDELRNPR